MSRFAMSRISARGTTKALRLTEQWLDTGMAYFIYIPVYFTSVIKACRSPHSVDRTET